MSNHKNEISEDDVGRNLEAFGAKLDEIRAASPPPVSGLYKAQTKFLKAVLRLDVDGYYPQMVASGTLFQGIQGNVHWIADLELVDSSAWKGEIWYKDGDTGAFPYTAVRVVVQEKRGERQALVRFVQPALDLVFRYASPCFHTVEFEFDHEDGTSPVTKIKTHAHPNRPATLPEEILTVQECYRRAGFCVGTSSAESTVPLTGAGTDALWSDMEMHDAMQIYWSRFADVAQWAMWVFFAGLHEASEPTPWNPNPQPEDLGGIMFDQIGPNHRQGTAIFNDSFISVAPAGDAAPAAWVRRQRFWTVCHEMGHAFNLAHSWQKAFGTPWIPLANEPDALSFMNYPYFYPVGFSNPNDQTAFFADFEFRFSDGELLFMRHAPARFVQMGNADWFDHHGLEQAAVSPEPAFELELRANRKVPVYEFMEPQMLELKLTNISVEPKLVHKEVLGGGEALTLIVKKRGRPARQVVPFAQYCLAPGRKVLNPGESVYESLFPAAGLNGWDLAEPGNYMVQVMLQIDGEDIVSNPMTLRVLPPRSYDEEHLAQDFFSDDVGRILAFDGSRELTKGNDTLREVADRLGDRPVANHARIALATPLTREYKQLALPDGKAAMTGASLAGGKISVAKPDEKRAKAEFSAALTDNPQQAAETLEHCDYHYYCNHFSDWLAEIGDRRAAASVQNGLVKVLTDRKVLMSVLDDIRTKRDNYKGKKSN